MPRLLIATRNRHKTAELRALLGPDFQVGDLTAHPELPEIAETGSTFLENAALKACGISAHLSATGGASPDGDASLVLADDSGLEVDALGGAPGVFSARFAGEHASDRENVAKLLADLAAAALKAATAANERGHGANPPAPAGEAPPAARFRCAIAIAQNGRQVAAFEGACEGAILGAPRGAGGFGYDPVFVPQGETQTFAELPAATKNAMSHRGRATQAALEWLRGRLGA